MLSIQHNLFAANAARQLKQNQQFRTNHAERLASGYRINRAADDAANLAISEKMRSQIRGLDQSLDNVQNGMALCNIADGALNEVHDILRRMRELAVQGANGTYTDEDRAMLDDELNHLRAELDRIGTDTEYNTMQVFTKEATKVTTITTTLDTPTAMGAFFQLMGSDASNGGYMDEQLSDKKVELGNSTSDPEVDYPYVSVHIDFKNIIKANDNKIQQLEGTQFYVNCCTDCCPCIVTFTNDTTHSITDNSSDGTQIGIGLKKADGSYYTDAAEFVAGIVQFMQANDPGGYGAQHVEFMHENGSSVLYLYDVDNKPWTENQKQDAYFCDVPGSTFTIGEVTDQPDSGFAIQMSHRAYDLLRMNFGELSAKSLKLQTVNFRTQKNCMEAIASIQEATGLLAVQRSNIGAYSNRLQHTYDNNFNVMENTQAAESRIRDADMAEEILAEAKYNILMQASQSMLSQANQSAGNVLHLITN